MYNWSPTNSFLLAHDTLVRNGSQRMIHERRRTRPGSMMANFPDN